MANQYVMARRDYDNDKQQSSFDLIPGATVSQCGDLDVGFASWLEGSQGGTFFKQELQSDTGAGASSPIAQGTLVMIVDMTDSVNGRTYVIKAPIPDLAKADDVGANPAWIVQGGLTVANPAHADYATLVAVIEAVYQSPVGNTGTVARIYIRE